MDTPKTSREKIIDAARILIARSETHDIRLRDVGELAGVSMGSITHHFSSKSELLEACLDEYYERIAELGEQLAALATEPMNLNQLVSSGARLVYRFYQNEYASLRLRAATSQVNGKMLSNRLHEVLTPTRESVAEILVKRASLPAVKARLIVQSITYLAVAYVLCPDDEFARVMPEGTPRSAVEEHIVDVALSLVAAPSSSAVSEPSC